jgi:hypothetical protein
MPDRNHPALRLTRGSPPGAESFDNLIRLVLRDLNQVIRRLGTFPFDNHTSELPGQISCEDLVAETATFNRPPPGQAGRLLTRSSMVNDRVVLNLFSHTLSNLPCDSRR